MKKFKQLIVFTLALSLSLTGILVYFKFNWWLTGSLSNFKLWYSKFGMFLWLLKILFIIVSSIASILVIQKILSFSYIGFNKIPKQYRVSLFLFCSYLLLAPLFDGNHPFSTFSMYNSFPNWAYNFRLENKEGELIPYAEISSYRSPDATDLYQSFLQKKNIYYGFGKETKEQYEAAGAYTIDVLIDNNKVAKNKIEDVYLTRVYFFVKDHEIVQQKTIVGEKHF